MVVDLIREALLLEVAGLFWFQPVNDLVYDIALYGIIGVLEKNLRALRRAHLVASATYTAALIARPPAFNATLLPSIIQ